MDASLLIVFLGTMTVTSYRPIPAQTDATPTITSIGDRTTRFGAAVSQDLLETGEIRYGDIIKIEGLGLRVVNDCMNKRHRRSIDLLVLTHADEKRIGVRHSRIWRLRDGNGKQQTIKKRY